MYCDQCGMSVGEKDTVCPECGAPIKRKFKLGKWKIPLICLVVIGVVIATVWIAAGEILINTAKKATLSPEEYYRWVETKKMKETTATISSMYSNYVLDMLKEIESSTTIKAKLTVGDDLENFETFLKKNELDISWLESGELIWKHNLKDDTIDENISLSLNGQTITDFQAILDLDHETVYAGLPLLSEEYLTVDITKFDNANTSQLAKESLKTMSTWGTTLPDEAKVNQILNNYLTLMMDHMEEVELDKNQLLMVGEISQKCTRLKITYDYGFALDMQEAIYQALSEDEDIKDLIYVIYDELEIISNSKLKADDVYQSFIKSCEEKLNNIKEQQKKLENNKNTATEKTNKPFMYVYVDNTGNIVGREYTFEYRNYNTITNESSELHKITIATKTPIDGKKIGAELSISEDGVYQTAFIGDLTGNKQKGTVSGSFTVYGNGTDHYVFDIKDINLKEIKKGNLSGSICIDIYDLMVRNENNNYAWYQKMYEDNPERLEIARKNHEANLAQIKPMTDTMFVFGIKVTGKEAAITMNISQKENEILTLHLSTKREEAQKITLPEEDKSIAYENMINLEQFWKSLDKETLVDNLEKADLPKEFVDMVEEMSKGSLQEVIAYFMGMTVVK